MRLKLYSTIFARPSHPVALPWAPACPLKLNSLAGSVSAAQSCARRCGHYRHWASPRPGTGSGTYVLNASPASELNYGGYSARDLIEARPFIEVPAAGWAALRRSAEQLANLLKLCDKMDRQTDPQKWELLDSEFHCAIAEASGNTVFSKIVADAREALIQQSELVNLMSGRREASNVEHRLIVEAIEAGSETDARAAMEAHLSKVKTAVTTIIGKDEV
jgi:DNA-binding FadR family transcriptional regulator